MKIPRLLFVFLLALPLFAGAQDQATTNRTTELKDRADAGARTVTSLAENTSVKVLSRGSGWARIEAGGQSGYVRIFHLRIAGTAESAPSSTGSSILSSIGNAFTGQRSNAKANLATTGVRGLSMEELKNANPDPEALRRMQSFRADRATAERFARDAKLAAVRVDDPDAAASKGGR